MSNTNNYVSKPRPVNFDSDRIGWLKQHVENMLKEHPELYKQYADMNKEI